MADKRISQLIERVNIANNDVLPIVASGATTTNKVTISTIQEWMQDNLDVGVTSVGITIGSTGTDINVTGSPITTSGNITINIPTASATNRGLLSSSDWTSFNNKLSSVGLTMPSAFTVSNSPLTANGTIAVTGAGTVAQYIRGDGSLADFPEAGGGGASVSYYLNGSVSQGTIGGIAYREMNKTPILGAGTNFTIAADGYIASFITDAGDPNLILIPGGNWNLETYFQASSGGGTPSFYVELYKVDSGGTATLIASNSANPELIAFGTTTTAYFSSLAVPPTVLTLTDRLALRYYVTHAGRTITMHTEDANLCQVITTFTTGLTALNGLTAQVQNFATGTSGTDFNISSTSATHTFNLPDASASNRGAVTTGTQTFAGAKTFNSSVTANSLIKTGGTSSQFLKADGSVDSNTYLTTASASAAYVPYTGANSNLDLGQFDLDADTIRVNGSAPSSGSYLGFKHSTNVTSGADGYTSMYTFGTNTISYKSVSGATTKDFSFSMASITPNVAGGRVYTLPDASGTLALTSDLGVYLPLTGGTLTGALNGTSATFSGDLQSSTRLIAATGGQSIILTANSGGTTNRIEGSAGLPMHIVTSGSSLAFAAGGTTPQITLASSGAVTLTGALNGTSASFNGNVTSLGFRSSSLDGFVLRNDGNNLNLGGLTRRGFWAGGTAADTQIFAETGYGIFLNTGGSTSSGLSLSSTGAATFSSSVGIGVAPTNRLTALASETGTQITTTPVAKFANTGNAFSKVVIGSDNANFDGVISMDNNATLANTKLRFYIGNGTNSTAGHSNDQIVLQGNGNVGIGTASPATTLHVERSNPTRGIIATIRNSATSGQTGSQVHFVQESVADWVIGQPAGTDAFAFWNNRFPSGDGTERMRITSVGFTKARANGGSYFNGSYHEIVNNNNVSGDICLVIGNAAGSNTNNTSSITFVVADAGNNRLYIYGNGNVVNQNGSYGSISDVKLKENIEDASPKLDDLMKVKVRNYNLIGDDKKQIGVIAQELEEVFPAMIDESEDFEEVEVPQVDEEGNDILNEEGEVLTTKERVSKGSTTKSVKYSVFVPMLIKAMQEQQEQIKSLTEQVEALKSQING
jgi:hypothetical protein